MSKTPYQGTEEGLLPPAGGVDTHEATDFPLGDNEANFSVTAEIAAKDKAAIDKFNHGTLSNG